MGASTPLNPFEHPVIFFDGVCNLCNGTVQTIIKYDTKGVFRFASLQSEYARNSIPHAQSSSAELYSVILLKNGRVYDRSNAVLEIARQLGGFWNALYVFKIVPRKLRDLLYKWIANNRYRWFGQRDACMVPTPELRDRFIL